MATKERIFGYLDGFTDLSPYKQQYIIFRLAKQFHLSDEEAKKFYLEWEKSITNNDG